MAKANQCAICGTPLKDDLFASVAQEPVCAICKVKFIGGLPTTPERINTVREQLQLKQGEFLKQDPGEEARKLLGK